MKRSEQLERKLGEMRRVASLFQTLAMEIGDRGFLRIHQQMKEYLDRCEELLSQGKDYTEGDSE
jgi:hypothetical protein